MLETENSGIVIVRGVHPEEVSAFCLSNDISKVLKRKGYYVSLETVPYKYSLNYLADNKPEIISAYYKTSRTPCFYESVSKEFKMKLKKVDPSGKISGIWAHNISHQVPCPVFEELREMYDEEPIFDFHNSWPMRSEKVARGVDRKLFTLGDGYYGFIRPEENIENLYTVEIPAFSRKVPREILERRRKTIKVIKKYESRPELVIRYLENVVDFKKSSENGLTDRKAVRKIAETVEDVVKEGFKL